MQAEPLPFPAAQCLPAFFLFFYAHMHTAHTLPALAYPALFAWLEKAV